ncbi:L-fuconolactonase [Streptomyces sp. B4I13]|uniref:amidohydrolase family protein n=1 Tax=Streptomyces sp. B4I13 TaxID=3042271 RepID=UPI0027822B50|nr:amidohydrolase family protein [Streptomyces sp. B4I13]MDQ0959149.1 L-fuconolactonase [Streptomyces sp. B4I13]
MIVDSHVHVIAEDASRYPSILRSRDENAWYSTHPVTAEELLALMDDGGVAWTILVQPIQVYGSDNSYLADSCAAYPERLRGVAVVDVGEPAASRADLHRSIREQGLAGIRVNLATGAETIDPRCHPLLESAAESDVPVLVRVTPEQLPQLPALIKRFPGVAFVLDHCGFVDFRDGPDGRGAAPLFEVGAHDNLYVKVSTMNLYGVADDPGTLLKELGRCFGTDRLVWGSDYPHTCDRGYAGLVDYAREAARALPGEGAEDYLGRTAAKLWCPSSGSPAGS